MSSLLMTQLFPPYCQRERAKEQGHHRTIEKGHGRVEVRSIRTTTALNNYLNWPGVQQVCEVTRERTIKGKKSIEVVYYITSLSPSKANAEDLLEMMRNHWGAIENGLHYLRDTLYAEDKSTIRTGHSAQNLATLRNTALSILRDLKVTAFAKTLREFSRQSQRLLNYL